MADTDLQTLMEQVQAHKKYSQIHPDLVQRLSQQALDQGLSGKTAMKTVRSKLHQVGGAYFRQNIPYEDHTQTLRSLPEDISSRPVRAFCREVMAAHASTAERLPILDTFFHTCLASLAPVESILDLACGLTPLSIPWMPLAPDATYLACDIYLDLLAFVQRFFDAVGLQGVTQPCDLVTQIPEQPVQVALLLKALPCLEQLDKEIGLSLLQKIPCSHILVSFPVRSLGGRKVGMPDHYQEHFLAMVRDMPWAITSFSFQTELAFLVEK
jgi:16S rRNA (guanine(1405)-N(7))-methyltransferase